MIDVRNALVLGLTVTVGTEATWSMPVAALIGLAVSLVWFWPFLKANRIYIAANVGLSLLMALVLVPNWVNNVIALTMPFAMSLFWFKMRLKTAVVNQPQRGCR